TRDLIKELAGEHTIILSTHILPEVEQICERVVIIAKGKLVATDTVENLTRGLRGVESVSLEVMGAGESAVRERLERVAGVNKVTLKEPFDGGVRFTIEGDKARNVRPELARAIVESGWQLNELHSMSMSLEEIFLELTGDKTAAAAETTEAAQ
ncbi:MAG: ABC transporter ATP-binding protein, partial [Acidobacteriota bacterium]